MNASAGTSKPAANRWPRFRFSLRMLLLAFTATAIGFPIWYRWPYTEESQLPADKTKPPVFKIVTTWRRTWGGGKAKHGPETRESRDGKSRVVKHYRDGVLDGPHNEYYQEKQIASGQYVSGKKTGRWERRSIHGDVQLVTTWNEGKLDGPAEMPRPDGTALSLKFEDGSLVELRGKPVLYSFAELKSQIRSHSERLSNILDDSTNLEFVETPLKDALAILTDTHGIPQGLRVVRAKADADLPVTANLSDIDLLSALAIVGGLNDLGLDYRYGCLWFTSAEDAVGWTDPTGVLAIQPVAGSLLADIWREPVNATTTVWGTTSTQPLATVLQSLATQVGADIDTSQVDPTAEDPNRYATTFHINQHPFHQALGILLYESGCRCELNGGKLVILPPENSGGPRE